MPNSDDVLKCFRLDGRVALVTGAAQGLGRAITSLFLDAGASVVIADLNGQAADATAAELEAKGPVLAVAMDVSDEPSVQAGFAAAAERFGGVDVLVNNAAYRNKDHTITMAVEEWDRMHAVTARGTFLCLREAVKQMRGRGGGSIVNVSSMSGVHPTLLANMHYDSAKAGVCAITRLAAVEFAKDKIRVNTMLPGGMATPGAGRVQSSPDLMQGPATIPGRSLMGRAADPIEMARAVLFLASDAASYITGAELLVDAGYTKG